MNEGIAHYAMRNELVSRLSDAMSDDAELNCLCDFLHDDFPYNEEDVVGLVLRYDELVPWQHLMAAVGPASIAVRDEELDRVRKRAAALLEEMRR